MSALPSPSMSPTASAPVPRPRGWRGQRTVPSALVEEHLRGYPPRQSSNRRSSLPSPFRSPGLTAKAPLPVLVVGPEQQRDRLRRTEGRHAAGTLAALLRPLPRSPARRCRARRPSPSSCPPIPMSPPSPTPCPPIPLSPPSPTPSPPIPMSPPVPKAPIPECVPQPTAHITTPKPTIPIAPLIMSRTSDCSCQRGEER